MRAWAFWGLAAAVIALDQWTKQLVVERMQLHESIPLLPGALHLTYVHNTGTAFGLFSGGGRFLVAVAVAAALFITGYWVFLRRREPPPSPWLLAGLALPLGGAIGNLIDRLRYGYVIDFVDFRVWPVFNVADSAITIGAILIAACFLLTPQPRKEPVPVEAEAASPPADDRAPGAPAAAAPAIQSESS